MAMSPRTVREQQERRERSVFTNPISIDKDKGIGRFRGSCGETYRVTLTSCDCCDFRKRRLTCKHIYRLKDELGYPHIPIDATIRPIDIPHPVQEVVQPSGAEPKQCEELKNIHQNNGAEERGKKPSFVSSALTFLKKVCASIIIVTLIVVYCLPDSKSSSPGDSPGKRLSSGVRSSGSVARINDSSSPRNTDVRIETTKPAPESDAPTKNIAADTPSPPQIPDKYELFAISGPSYASRLPAEPSMRSEVANATTGAWTGECVGISDGDTISVMRDGKPVKVRLYGIDSPERGQDFGERAREFVGRLAFRKNVTVIPVDMDRYGRIVAQISIDSDEDEDIEIAHVEVNGVNLSRSLVESGFAWVYDQHCTAPECNDWRALQDQARLEKRGLWSHLDAISPWEWRRRQKRESYGMQATEQVQYHGNTSSLIFHRPSCRHFNCRNCTKLFDDRHTAIQAGYRPCDICRP